MNPEQNIETPAYAGDINIARTYFCPVGATCAVYSDDLESLAVGQEDGTVQLFQNGDPLKILRNLDTDESREPVTDIKVKSTPLSGYHKTLLASYASGDIRLWDITLGKCLFVLSEKRQVYGVAYHHGGSKFLTYGDNRTVLVYDEETRTIERVLSASEKTGSTNGHTDKVCCAVFHPKHFFEVVSGGVDGSLQFWDLRAPYAQRSALCGAIYGDGIDFSPDGARLVTCSSEPRGTCRVWDYKTGEVLNEMSPGRGWGYCVRWMTQNTIACGSYSPSFLRILNINTCECLAQVGPLQSCVMSCSVRHKMSRDQQETVWPGLVVSSGRFVLEIQPTREIK